MIDANLAVEKAVLAVLRADAGVTALVGAGGVLDVVPADRTFPYVEIGEGQLVPDAAEGFEHSAKCFVTLNCYSREAGKPQVRKLCGAILQALDQVELDLGPDYHPADLAHETTRLLVEEDGITHRGVVSFSAPIDLA